MYENVVIWFLVNINLSKYEYVVYDFDADGWVIVLAILFHCLYQIYVCSDHRTTFHLVYITKMAMHNLPSWKKKRVHVSSARMALLWLISISTLHQSKLLRLFQSKYATTELDRNIFYTKLNRYFIVPFAIDLVLPLFIYFGRWDHRATCSRYTVSYGAPSQRLILSFLVCNRIQCNRTTSLVSKWKYMTVHWNRASYKVFCFLQQRVQSVAQNEKKPIGDAAMEPLIIPGLPLSPQWGSRKW